MNTKKDIPQNYISPFAKETLVKEIVKKNTIALRENTETQNTNNTELDEIKLDEDFKKNYGALKSQTGGTIHTVVIANAEGILENMRKQLEKILENMRKQFENNFENDGRE